MTLVVVHGPDPALVVAVQAGLHAAGYTLYNQPIPLPWTVDVAVAYTTGTHIELDSVDGPFERMLLKALEQYSATGAVLLKRRGGVRQDRHCALGIPPDQVEAAVRALCWALHVVPTMQRRQPWYRRWFRTEDPT
jgi:hypothetical protein